MPRSPRAVRESVRKQAECGIDIVTDGEISKPGFYTYVKERLDGFEARPDHKLKVFETEVAAFPEYYEEYFKGAMLGGAIVSIAPVVCVGPVKYRGRQGGAGRHRQSQGRRQGGRRRARPAVPAGDRAERRRPQ